MQSGDLPAGVPSDQDGRLPDDALDGVVGGTGPSIGSTAGSGGGDSGSGGESGGIGDPQPSCPICGSTTPSHVLNYQAAHRKVMNMGRASVGTEVAT